MESIYYPVLDYKVFVRCMTFNQSKYIEETLNGFVIQKTSFPFVCLVMDDCSTDGEQKVIKTWMKKECDMDVAQNIEIELSDIIIVPHKTNRNCIFAFYFLKENLYKTNKRSPLINAWLDKCVYCAICEGDDFWCDPLKLQKQVDFLETHPEHSLCFHAVNDIFPNGETKKNSRYKTDVYECPIEDYFKKGGAYAPTCSMVYVNGKLEPEPSFRKVATVGDSPMILTLFLRGRVGFLNKVMACYRVNASNSWSKRQKQMSLKQILEKLRKNLNYWDEVDRYTKGIYAKYVRKRKLHTWLSLVKSLYYFVCGKLSLKKR